MSNTTPDTPPLTRYTAPGIALRAVMHLLAWTGLAITAYLLIKSYNTQALLGCDPGSACDLVLSSAWSKWFGVPVAALSVAVYAVMAVALWFVGPAQPPARQRSAWIVLLLGGFVLISGAIWFTGIQLVQLKQYCPYCLSAHVVGTLLGLLVLVRSPIGRAKPAADEPVDPAIISAGTTVALLVVALVGLAALAGTQIFEQRGKGTTIAVVDPSVTTNPSGQDALLPHDPNRSLAFLGGQITLKPHEHPILGSPDAKHIWIEMFDYTCPHCRLYNKQLKLAKQHYGPQLAIITLPVPLESKCNPVVKQTHERHFNACEYAKLALAVWRTRPELFSQFHDWLFEPEMPPLYSTARDHAAKLIGEQALRLALNDPWLTREIMHNVNLYIHAGSGPIPKTIIGSQLRNSRPMEMQELYDFVEQHSDMRPVRP